MDLSDKGRPVANTKIDLSDTGRPIANTKMKKW